MNVLPVSLPHVLARVRRPERGRVVDVAAQVAFFAVLSVAPFLLVVVSLTAFLPSPDTVHGLLDRLEALMPAEAFRLVSALFEDLVERRSGALFTVGLLTALWSASKAANALRKALNAAYHVEESRPWLQQRLLGLGVTVAGAVLLIASLVATLLGGQALVSLAAALGFDASARLGLWSWARWPLAVFSVGALAALAYRTLPDVRPRARAVVWGAVTATVLFVACGLGFSYFTHRFSNFGLTYGALTGFVLLMLWAWLSAIAFVVGGEVTASFPNARPRH